MSSGTPDPLAGIRSKIERAKKHVADLDAAIRAFLDSKPYKVGAERDPDTRKMVYYVVHVEDVHTDITQIAGDALASMVSILDHLAYRLFLTAKTGGDGRHVYFPITKNATNAAEYVAERKRKVKDIPPAIVADLDALEPYKGGKGHQLWVLNELNNLAKHRDLIAVGSRFRSVDVGSIGIALLEKQLGLSLPRMPLFLRPANPLCPLKVGDVLFTDAVDAEPNPQMEFSFDVALNEPQIIHAEPLIEAVHQLAGAVDGIVGQFAKYL
jgi:hypothetical protein